MKKRIVVKLSGQVFSMDETKKLKDYATFFVKKSKTHQPIIVAGGGKIARYFISHARSSGADESTLDELGIEISRLNAKLLIYALKGKAYPHPPTTLAEVKIAVALRNSVAFTFSAINAAVPLVLWPGCSPPATTLRPLSTAFFTSAKVVGG